MAKTTSYTAEQREQTQSVTLKPFDVDSAPAIAVLATLTRHGNDFIFLDYNLLDDDQIIAWPPPSLVPSRKDYLWKLTCLEAFFSLPDTKSYWEVNLSPTGDWNLYHFDDYRSGMKEEIHIADVDIKVSPRRLKAKVPIGALQLQLPPAAPGLDLSVAAIMERNDNHSQSFWAVSHTGSEADFHRRDSFVVKL